MSTQTWEIVPFFVNARSISLVDLTCGASTLTNVSHHEGVYSVILESEHFIV